MEQFRKLNLEGIPGLSLDELRQNRNNIGSVFITIAPRKNQESVFRIVRYNGEDNFKLYVPFTEQTPPPSIDGYSIRASQINVNISETRYFLLSNNLSNELIHLIHSFGPIV